MLTPSQFWEREAMKCPGTDIIQIELSYSTRRTQLWKLLRHNSSTFLFVLVDPRAVSALQCTRAHDKLCNLLLKKQQSVTLLLSLNIWLTINFKEHIFSKNLMVVQLSRKLCILTKWCVRIPANQANYCTYSFYRDNQNCLRTYKYNDMSIFPCFYVGNSILNSSKDFGYILYSE